MDRRSRPVASGARVPRARLPMLLGAILLGLCVRAARADDVPAPDPLVGTWVVDVAATTKRVSEIVSLEIDALPAAERAEELLRRDTFLKALRFTAAADGSFLLFVPGEETRASRGTWKGSAPGLYTLSLTARFGVKTAGVDAEPFSARLAEGVLSYRDASGSTYLFRRAPAPDKVSTEPAAPAAPVSRPAAYVATWELDRDRMVDVTLAVARKQLEALEPDKRRIAEEMLGGDRARDVMRKQLESMEIQIELREDGTLDATLGLPGRDIEHAIGTWREAEGKVLLTLTQKNGEPVTGNDLKPVDGRLEGLILWLEMRGEGPAIPLRKRER